MVKDYNRSPQEVLEELHTSPLGLTAAEITAGVASYVPTGSRMRVLHLPEGRLLIDDCYNANPQAMTEALKLLSVTGWDITQSVQMVLHRSKVLTPQIEGFLSELSRALADALTQPAP